MSSTEIRKLIMIVESAIVGWDNKVRAEADHWIQELNQELGCSKEMFLKNLENNLVSGRSAFGKMPHHDRSPKETREYREAFADVKKSVEAAVTAGKAKFRKANSVRAERAPKEESPDRGYQTKPTIQEYNVLAGFLESVYGEFFPDGDPMDAVMDYYKKYGWSEGKGVAVLTKALKLINKKYESASDLWADQWDMFMSDADPEYNPDLYAYKNYGNPWR